MALHGEVCMTSLEFWRKRGFVYELTRSLLRISRMYWQWFTGKHQDFSASVQYTALTGSECKSTSQWTKHDLGLKHDVMQPQSEVRYIKMSSITMRYLASYRQHLVKVICQSPEQQHAAAVRSLEPFWYIPQ